jgi:hypothetical protein
MDGVSLPVKCASDPISQATNYTEYPHDTMCHNVFCFAPTYAAINIPGSWHDSQVAQRLIAKAVRDIGDLLRLTNMIASQDITRKYMKMKIM